MPYLRFSTGHQIDEIALAMQAFFSRVIESSYVTFPIHLLVDTNLTNSHMGIQTSVYHKYGVPGNDNGSIFTPIQYRMSYYPEEMSASTWYIDQNFRVICIQRIHCTLFEFSYALFY